MAAERSLYSSLFRYVPSELRRPLEDFLTEAIADLLNRLLEKNNAVRKKTECFISEVLCNGSGGKKLKSSLHSAKRLESTTQRAISLDNEPKRLDLCLWGDNELLLVVENKVAQTRRGKADPTADESGSPVAEQLKSYARWLQKFHPGAGLVLLGIDQGPRDFLSDEKGEYPARFRSVCHWTQAWDWLRQLPSDAHLNGEQSILVKEFRRFMEEQNLSDITEKEVELLQNWLPYVQPFLSEIQGNIVEILKEVRTFSEELPEYSRHHRGGDLPDPNVRGDDVYAIGDLAYCYDGEAKHHKLMKLKWYVGWGFQTLKGKQRGALQAFVCIESDADGLLIPPPTAKKMTSFKGKGWQFSPPIVDKDGECSAFEKVHDAATFLPGFTKASVDWFKDGIREAAEILESAKKRLAK